MPLYDLREYIPTQNERIGNLPPEAITPSAHWKAFGDNFWDKLLKDLEHEELVDEDSRFLLSRKASGFNDFGNTV